ncbi:MAG: DHH family phosphoesterase [Chloroflexota bacterium]|nr:DHH family phosphoesterase [Chloroflexota bacterium]
MRAAVVARIRRSRRPLIVSHRNPDPDSLGSALGLAAIFDALGASPVLAVSEPESIDPVMATIPGSARFHPLTVDVLAAPPHGQAFDALFSVDTASLYLLSSEDRVRAALAEIRPIVNIDHHVTNERFGDLNYVVSDAAAAAEVIWMLLSTLGGGISRAGAIALQAGLVADTLGFQTKETGPRTLRAAAALQAMGGDTSDVPRRVLNVRTFEASRLLGAALAAAVRSEDGRVIWTQVSAEMAAGVGARIADSQGIPNVLQDIADAVAVAVFYEVSDSRTRVSLRSLGPRIDGVAASFGGGGHALAAGATVHAPLNVATEQVLARMAKALDGS